MTGMSNQTVSIHELEGWLHANVVGVVLDLIVDFDRLQGIHLSPGSQMTIPLKIVIEGKPLRRNDPRDFLDDGNFETGSL